MSVIPLIPMNYITAFLQLGHIDEFRGIISKQCVHDLVLSSIKPVFLLKVMCCMSL